MSNAILAVIAYTDAITIKAEGKINQKDHSTAPALLRSVLGRDLPDARFKDLQNLLSTKDEMQYGVKLTMQDTARDALSRLDTFGDWAKSWLEARGIA
ncbi:hypothetical protein [Muricoccus vinaceus]|uniref:Uncharacterized protein n=1 Tax=Muricoccus vinaceus TaxID=424704 RepID=A0ABV6IVS8_9PROT